MQTGASGENPDKILEGNEIISWWEYHAWVLEKRECKLSGKLWRAWKCEGSLEAGNPEEHRGRSTYGTEEAGIKGGVLLLRSWNMCKKHENQPILSLCSWLSRWHFLTMVSHPSFKSTFAFDIAKFHTMLCFINCSVSASSILCKDFPSNIKYKCMDGQK